jgi:hypothetical protein
MKMNSDTIHEVVATRPDATPLEWGSIVSLFSFGTREAWIEKYLYLQHKCASTV